MTMNILDPMFPTRANPRDRDILIGERPNRMVNALERIFDLSLQNSLVTYVSGDVGSGKSHVLNHIQYLSERNKNRHVVIINANQFDSIDDLTILRSIHADDRLRNQSLRDGIRFSDTASLNREELIDEINRGLEILDRKSTNTKGFGLIVGIDGLDEFVRDKTLDTSQLLISIRLLLEDLHKACFVLSLTHSILDEAKGVGGCLAEDRTFSRRFIGPQEYDGTPLNFIGFNLSETFEMFKYYRDRWLERRLADGETDQERYDEFKKSEWPISKDAISLAWGATTKTPWALQLLFQNAFNDLKSEYFNNDWFNLENIVTPQQMARVIETAVRRAESGVSIGEVEFENTIRILRDEGRYLTVPLNNIESREDTIVRFIKGIIEEIGFTTEGLIPSKKRKAYLLKVMESTNSNNYQYLGFLIALDRPVTESDVNFLNELVMGELRYKPRYVIILTNDENCRDVYDGVGGVQRRFIRECHLGNYTYLIQLTDNQIDDICAAYQQRDEDYYKALLKIMDKRCCAKTGLSLSEIFKAIIHATFEQ
ncbi:MAG: hypothetical protein U9O85_03875 [Euryarchaeota archaeon]|nr:hypothetical protein [Euryarchaeota archaeon]